MKIKSIFTPPTYDERLERQKNEAREQHLEHSAAAEYHFGLAEMYGERYKRLQKLQAERVQELALESKFSDRTAPAKLKAAA